MAGEVFCVVGLLRNIQGGGGVVMIVVVLHWMERRCHGEDRSSGIVDWETLQYVLTPLCFVIIF